ncbi:unnamed protein product [Strongylus vulgaris]|uniref:Protein phosphatase n=1 Tax=Strongylus vulgaris TaxID=40348 RepID=A0A3P7LJZ4_STRVU|nr:unnamed protein product [Strongylus vulgaris]
MRECEKRVSSGDFDPKRPETLLEKAFKATAESPRPVGMHRYNTEILLYSYLNQQLASLGSSTACVLVVHQEMLYSANLGDSGFMVVRDGRVLTKSEEQVHYFNAPFQLTLPPEGRYLVSRMLYLLIIYESSFDICSGYRGFIGDTPDLADKSEIRVQKGDIVLLATDGLWDNLTEQHVLDQLRPLIEEKATVQEHVLDQLRPLIEEKATVQEVCLF